MERSMRALLIAFASAMSTTVVVAQTTSQQAAKIQTHDAALLDEKARVAECMKLWEKSTRMTRSEWEASCRRVAEERVKYLREQGYGTTRK
jgi:hypothetical protein